MEGFANPLAAICDDCSTCDGLRIKAWPKSPSITSAKKPWIWLHRRGNTLKLKDYAIRIEPLPCGEGGGFLVTVPDLPGCMADGETVEAAIAQAHDAFKAWAGAEQQDRGTLPTPKTYSGQLRVDGLCNDRPSVGKIGYCWPRPRLGGG